MSEAEKSKRGRPSVIGADTSIQIKMPTAMREAVQRVAKSTNRSMATVIRMFIEAGLKRWKSKE